MILPGLSIQSVSGAAEAVEAGYAAFSEEFTVYVFDRRLDLEMPGGPGATGEEILEAVKEGSLKEEDLDKAVLNLLSFVERSLAEKKEGAGIDRKACSALARDLADSLRCSGPALFWNGSEIVEEDAANDNGGANEG